MPELPLLALIAFAFLLAGTVKGAIGLGLPTVILALLTVALDLPRAMALLLVPSFVTNVWQAAVGGHARAIVRRIWPFLLMATITVWIGALALTRVNLPILSALLGVLLIVYATVSLSGYHFELAAGKEIWAGPLTGAINGILTGMTGSFAVPGVMYLQAIGLKRDMLIQAMGMLFTVSTLALAVALHGNRLLTIDLATVSAVATVPALIGMVIGRKLRQALSERVFRRVFFIALLVLGLYILARAVGRLV